MNIVDTQFAGAEGDIGTPYAVSVAARVAINRDEIDRAPAWDGLSPGEKALQAAKMEVYAAMITRMDQEIGRMVHELAAMGVLDDSLILFLSDNGSSSELAEIIGRTVHNQVAPVGRSDTFYSLGAGWSSVSNAPFRRHKAWVHEGGIASPFIVHWPRAIARGGGLRADPTHLVDIWPTFAELAGIAPARHGRVDDAHARPGTSLVPAFARGASIERNALWWLHEGSRALRVGHWKIVSAAERSGWPFMHATSMYLDPALHDRLIEEALDAPWELYDLSRDRAELRNLASVEPGRVRAMAALWEQEYARARAWSAP